MLSSAPSPSIRQQMIALGFGAACHGLFLIAIGTAMLAMYHGMHLGLVNLPWPLGVTLNLILLLQFPLLHSYLLTRRGSRQLSRCAPDALGRDLSTTSFTIIAAIQLLALYALWSPIGPVWWESQGVVRWMMSGLYAFSWLLLGRSMFDAGLALQTGFLGWSAVFRGRRPNYGKMPQEGLFRYTRQPIYLAFALTMWTVPVWTADQLIVALWFTSYCLLGPIFKERRYQQRYGEQFRDYRRKTPYFFPSVRAILRRDKA
jgi:methanethiol S-methyltransferase